MSTHCLVEDFDRVSSIVVCGEQRLESMEEIRHSHLRSQAGRGAGVVQQRTPALGAGCLWSSCGGPAWTWRKETAAWSRSWWREAGRKAPSLAAAAAPHSLPSQPAAGSWLRPAPQRTSGPERSHPWRKNIEGQVSMINGLLFMVQTIAAGIYKCITKPPIYFKQNSRKHWHCAISNNIRRKQRFANFP